MSRTGFRSRDEEFLAPHTHLICPQLSSGPCDLPSCFDWSDDVHWTSAVSAHTAGRDEEGLYQIPFSPRYIQGLHPLIIYIHINLFLLLDSDRWSLVDSSFLSTTNSHLLQIPFGRILGRGATKFCPGIFGSECCRCLWFLFLSSWKCSQIFVKELWHVYHLDMLRTHSFSCISQSLLVWSRWPHFYPPSSS